MKLNQIFIIFFLIQFLTNGLYSQSLNKMQTNILITVERTLTKLERNIGKLEAFEDKSNIMYVNNYKRQEKSVARDFKSIATKLNGLPGSPEVNKTLKKFNTIKSFWETLSMSVAKSGEEKKALNGNWDNFKNSKAYIEDMETIKGYNKLYLGYFKINDPAFKHFQDTDYLQRLNMVKDRVDVSRKLNRIKLDFEKYGKLSQSEVTKIKRALEMYLKHENDLKKSRVEGLSFLETKLEELEHQIADAFKRHEGALAYGQDYTGIDEMILNPYKWVTEKKRISNRVVEYLSTYDTSFKLESAGILKKINNAYHTAAEKAAKITMASKKKPVNEYKGSDYNALVSVVKNRFSNKKVLGVYFGQSWEQTEEYVYDTSTGRMQKESYSTLQGKVYLNLNNDYAIERYIWIRKYHKGGAIRVLGDFRDYGSNPPLRVQFPLQRLN